MEVSRNFKGEFQKKWNDDARKLIRQMRDLIVRMNKSTKGKETILRQLQCVGILAAGFTFQVFRMTCPGGDICLLQPEGECLDIPRSIEKFSDIVPALRMIHRVKEILEDCNQVLGTPLTACGESTYYISWVWDEFSSDNKLHHIPEADLSTTSSVFQDDKWDGYGSQSSNVLKSFDEEWVWSNQDAVVDWAERD